MSWRLAHSLDQLRGEVRARWPGTTVWTIGDAAHRGRASDHNPNAAGVVCAIDVVGVDQARALWQHLTDTRDERIAYLIFDGKIVSSTTSPWQVRDYRGSNPHADHLHVSVGRGPDGAKTRRALYDDRSSWQLARTGNDQEDDQMLTNGDKGPAVALVQTCLVNEAAAAGRDDPLPRFGVDGDYGNETRDAVRRYQRAANIARTGNVDGLTAALLVRWE